MADDLSQQALEQMQAGRHCAEAVALTILQKFGADDPGPSLKIASAFGGGIAGSTQDLCGAFSGGVIALAHLLGRQEPGQDLQDCARLIKELRQGFLGAFGSLNCRTLLEGQASEENPVPACPHITAQTAAMLGEILSAHPELLPGPAELRLAGSSKVQLAPGACPFGGCGC